MQLTRQQSIEISDAIGVHSPDSSRQVHVGRVQHTHHVTVGMMKGEIVRVVIEQRSAGHAAFYPWINVRAAAAQYHLRGIDREQLLRNRAYDLVRAIFIRPSGDDELLTC